MDPNHLAKCISNVFKFRRPGACVGANDGSKLTAPFMEVVLVNTGTDGAVAERMLTPKDEQKALQAIALGHAIVALADKTATLERPDGKLRQGAPGDGGAPGGGSGDAGLEELLVLTHGAGGTDYGADYGAVLNVSSQARVSIGGADVNSVCACKMIFGYDTTKSNGRLKRLSGIGRDNGQRGDIPAG